MGEEPMRSWWGGMNGTPCPGRETRQPQGQQAPRLGQQDQGEHLTRGFTSSFPVTVNMVERPKGVHTAVGGEAKQGVSQHPTQPRTPRRVLDRDWGLSPAPCPFQTLPGTICRKQTLVSAGHLWGPTPDTGWAASARSPRGNIP